ncbi:hypothetical protein STEG23_000393, partial [Scotinomys teguina]
MVVRVFIASSSGFVANLHWSACTLPNSVLGLAEKPRRIEGVVSLLEGCTDQ